MRIRILRGRFFSASDRAGSEPVFVVDDLLVKKYGAGRDPIGDMIERDAHEKLLLFLSRSLAFVSARSDQWVIA